MKKKKEKKKSKKSIYDEFLESFEKLNESLEMMTSVSKSLRSTAEILRGPVQSNIANSKKNMKSTAEIIKDIKSTQIKLKGSKYSIFDADDLNII
ncbi:MAG: hypothetical protein ACFFBP_12825 [Promethearchaeota archaeon]